MSSPVAQLASVEGRRFVRNPAFWISTLAVVNFVRNAHKSTEAEDSWWLLTGYGFLLPGFVLVVAMTLAVLRGRFSRTEELLSTCAIGPDRRSIAHSMSALWCGALAAVAAVISIIVLRDEFRSGFWTPWMDQRIAMPFPNVAMLLQGPLAMVAVLASVVALVRWIPTWLVIVPLAFLLMVQGLFFGVFHGVPAGGTRWLFPLSSGIVNGEWVGGCLETTPCELEVSGYDLGTAWWHLGYLISLIVWCTIVAVLRHRRDRTAWTAFGVSTAAVAITVIAQLAVANEFTTRIGA